MNFLKSIIAILIAIYFYFIVFIDKVIGYEETSNYTIIKKTNNDINQYTERITSYIYESNKCKITWEVHIVKKKKKLLLKFCDIILKNNVIFFKEQFEWHKKIFEIIFKDWAKNDFESLILGPMMNFEISSSWNIRIAVKSINSFEWKDWKQNYPNHKTGKSINQIFVDLANNSNAYEELINLFNIYQLSIKLNSVEKVFVEKANKLSFYKQLQQNGIADNSQVIYDAGICYFVISTIIQK